MSDILDIKQPAALMAYLRRTGRIAADEQPAIRVLGGGVSNRTVLVERPDGEAWVLKQALEKLRVAVDWFSSPERVHREALGLRWLADLVPAQRLATLVFEDHAHHLLAMRAVPQPHDNWKSLLLAGHLKEDYVAQFGRLLGALHRETGAGAARHAEAARAFDDRSFFASLRFEPYYGYTATQVPAATGFLHRLIAETLATRVTLVHGDYSPKNVLVYRGDAGDGTLVLLDHEVIHYGDPAFDLGFSLTHLLSKAHYLRGQRDLFAVAANVYWDTYAATVGAAPWMAGVEERAVRHTLACLLARVAGRSPLEYLDAGARSRQREAVLALLARTPPTVPALIARFVAEV